MSNNQTIVELLLDSNIGGERVTTYRLTFPRIINAELLRHRCFSFSSASSRAIPPERMIEQYVNYVPERLSTNRKGMQPNEPVFSGNEFDSFVNDWKNLADLVKQIALFWKEKYNVSKEQVNRILEPFSYITVMIQGTERGYQNFFELRDHPDAQYEIRTMASEMHEIYRNSIPEKRSYHFPLVNNFDFTKETFLNMMLVSAARSARTSYFNFDGVESSIEEDIELFNKLALSKPIHASPLEFPVVEREWFYNNFSECQEKLFYSPGDLSGNLNSLSLIQCRKLVEKKILIFD